MQTSKVTSFPVVLLGHAYWDGPGRLAAGHGARRRQDRRARPRPVHAHRRPRRGGAASSSAADERATRRPSRRRRTAEAAREGARVVAAVCVFCSSSERIDPSYVELAADVGTELARRGHSLVSGGGSVVVMGAVARAARAGGAHTVGVIPRGAGRPRGRRPRRRRAASSPTTCARARAMMDARCRRVPHPARRPRHARGAARDLGLAHPRHARQAGRRARPRRRLRRRCGPRSTCWSSAASSARRARPACRVEPGVPTTVRPTGRLDAARGRSSTAAVRVGSTC